MVKHLPTMQNTWVRSLGQEDVLVKEMTTHSRTLAWKILWMEEPGKLQSMGLQRVRYDWVTLMSMSISATRVVSSVYLSLLIFLLEIFIPAGTSSSPAFLMMYSAYKLNKQGNNIHTWYTPFQILNQSVVPHPVLTVVSLPAYRFLRRQVRRSGIPISLRISQFIVIYTVKDFGIVNEADVFSGIPLLFLWSNRY